MHEGMKDVRKIHRQSGEREQENREIGKQRKKSTEAKCQRERKN